MAEVSVVTVEPRPIAAARQHVVSAPGASNYPILLERVRAFLRQNPGLETGGRSILIYRGTGATAHCQAGVEVVREFPATSEIVCTTTPAGRAVTATHWGALHDLSTTYRAIDARCRAEGHRIAHTSWEIFGDASDDPAKRRTDVFRLLR
jgi:effector-binding domain-containing protein